MDDKSTTGNPDRQRISTSEEYELRDWAKKFGVTPEELKAAVARVGTEAENVKRYLGK
ncbi:MAG TPA: DUF3606 domain-containing protein [Casimicrobiaceae bacterium]|nr:DUF3606 domain-containing protein [Casimicrobiaceae bacterium]